MERLRNTHVLLFLASVLPAICQAGDLEGRVVVESVASAGEKPRANPYPGQIGSSCCAEGSMRSGRDVRDFVIYVQGLVDTTYAHEYRPQLVQFQQTFEPRVLGIPVGTVVEFPNQDRVFHNVFSYSKVKRFDLGRYGRGKSASVTFDTPGEVRVFCDIHSNMSAFIYVVESTYVTKPDENGEFELANLPAGTHTLRFWHPELGEHEETVTIADDHTRIELSL